MQKLRPEDLLGLESYAKQRDHLRHEIIEYKQPRNVAVGPNCSLCFEDRKTIQYQVQEMLRAERVFESAGIQDELDAYNPLIPDGKNWKATMLLEYPNPEERRVALMALKSVENRCWVRISELDRVFGIADEDLPRENAEKTSAVHFLRFELTGSMVAALKAGASLSVGIDHPHYRHDLSPVPTPTREALCADLD